MENSQEIVYPVYDDFNAFWMENGMRFPSMSIAEARSLWVHSQASVPQKAGKEVSLSFAETNGGISLEEFDLLLRDRILRDPPPKTVYPDDTKGFNKRVHQAFEFGVSLAYDILTRKGS